MDKMIWVGNDTNLSNIGTTSFISNSRKFHLQKLYHVPNISANLLSVSQLSKDNNVFFEFHPDYFVVKDCCMGKALLQGKNKGGLYRFDSKYELQNPNPCSSALLSVSLSQCHQCLGHPMIRTVNKVIKSNWLLVSNKSVSFCHSCCIIKSCKLPFQQVQLIMHL